MDINLPGMSGIECLQHIKDVLPTVRVVMVSALEDKATVQAAARAGCLDFVTKPFNVSQLLVTLYVAMSQHTRTFTSGHWAERWNLLNDHERMLVRLIARGQRDKEIADQFAEDEDKVHREIRTLRGKLRVSCRTETVEYLHRNEGFAESD
jgi:two-component system response regulator FixJ